MYIIKQEYNLVFAASNLVKYSGLNASMLSLWVLPRKIKGLATLENQW